LNRFERKSQQWYKEQHGKRRRAQTPSLLRRVLNHDSRT
jgi:hypothetical protein